MPKKRNKLSDFLQAYYSLLENSTDEEIWKDINLGDFPLYEISNHGRVCRKDNGYMINPFHSYRKDADGNYIKERPTYLRVQLYYYENGIRKRKHCEISRLVALAFIPIPDKYLKSGHTSESLEVNHISGGYEIYNNFVNNLEWCTSKENIEKAFSTGLRNPPCGIHHHKSFLNDEDVVSICECIESGFNVKETYEKVSLSCNISYEKFKPNFYNIKYKNSWRFISQNYNF